MSAVCTDRFSYSKKDKEFVAELSDLGNFNPTRIFPDSTDIGFHLISHKTGKEVLFVHTTTEYRDDEIISWEFKSHSNNPNEKDLRVIIFND